MKCRVWYEVGWVHHWELLPDHSHSTNLFLHAQKGALHCLTYRVMQGSLGHFGWFSSPYPSIISCLLALPLVPASFVLCTVQKYMCTSWASHTWFFDDCFPQRISPVQFWAWGWGWEATSWFGVAWSMVLFSVVGCQEIDPCTLCVQY